MKISVILPVILKSASQIALARCCIAMMRANTDIAFELVIVETGSRHLENDADVYVHMPEKTNYTHDWNAGAGRASGEYLVHIGMDVLVGDRWLESMLHCFIQHPDCGVATTGVSEPGHVLGPAMPSPGINESFYGALMMFPSRWRLDPAFPDQMSDYDLCLRIYQAGYKSFRNNASHAFHMKLEHSIGQEAKMEKFRIGVMRFKQRWDNAPWLIARMIVSGTCKYGSEHLW